MTAQHDGPTPFSFPVKVGHVSHNPIEVHLEADAREREGLARLWGILGVDHLSADLRVRRWKKDGVKIMGEVRAKARQACVVTLEPVEEDIIEEVDRIFVPEGSPLARIPANEEGEIMIDPEGPDLPNSFTGNTIDMGALVAEVAAMSLDPYPKKQGAAFTTHVESDTTAERKPSPFAVLKSLKIDE